MGLFDSIAGKIARLAVGSVTLEDAQRRHQKRPDFRTLFDYEQIRRDFRDGKISQDCYRWLELVIITEAGTPVYTDLLTSMEDAGRPEFADFRRFVLEVWTPEESQHGDVCRAIGDAIGFRFDLASVRRAEPFIARYRSSCPPCKRMLGTAAYTVVQEEITFQSHRAYAECSGSAELARVGRVIAAEERYHSLFYANRLREVIQVLRDDGVPDKEIFATVATTVQGFEMPTRFHEDAYRAHVSQTHSDLAEGYIQAHMGEIKRQLAPLFIAAGGLSLVSAIGQKGFPLGKLEPEEEAELVQAAR
jgi:hypothetical protein